MTKTMPVAGTALELVERGNGSPLLFLHPGEGLAPERSWLDLLSRRFRVMAPWHHGYANSPLIDGSATVDPALKRRFAVDGKEPTTVIVVEVEQAFQHALKRWFVQTCGSQAAAGRSEARLSEKFTCFTL